MIPYVPKKWNLTGLEGISANTLDVHLSLYAAYVRNTNFLEARLIDARSRGKNWGRDPAFAELNRRLAWEFNGMRLHEYYFDNLTARRQDLRHGELYDSLVEGFDGFDMWKDDFVAMGGMRGVGWVVLCYDPKDRRLLNTWIEQHDVGNLAGCIPILVMDVWEHAWLRDYDPIDKSDYLGAFVRNINWDVCEARLAAARAPGLIAPLSRVGSIGG